MRRKFATSALLLSLSLAGGCKDGSSKPAPPADKPGSASATATASPVGPPRAEVDLKVDKESFGRDVIRLTGPAFLFVSGDPASYDWELRVFNDKAGAKCASEVSGPDIQIGGDGFAFRVENDRMSPGQARFDLKPAVLDGVSWTIYWPSPNDKKTTNSGNGASNSSVKVKFTSVSNDVATGEISGGLTANGSETVQGTFTAKICAKPEPEPAEPDK